MLGNLKIGNVDSDRVAMFLGMVAVSMVGLINLEENLLLIVRFNKSHR